MAAPLRAPDLFDVMGYDYQPTQETVDLDKSVGLVFFYVSKCNFQIVIKHLSSPLSFSHIRILAVISSLFH